MLATAKLRKILLIKVAWKHFCLPGRVFMYLRQHMHLGHPDLLMSFCPAVSLCAIATADHLSACRWIATSDAYTKDTAFRLLDPKQRETAIAWNQRFDSRCNKVEMRTSSCKKLNFIWLRNRDFVAHLSGCLSVSRHTRVPSALLPVKLVVCICYADGLMFPCLTPSPRIVCSLINFLADFMLQSVALKLRYALIMLWVHRDCSPGLC